MPSLTHRTQQFRYAGGGGASTGDLITLDAMRHGGTLTVGHTTRNYQQGMVYLAGDRQLHLGLASEYTASDDLRHYTFRLRPGLRWSDGSRFTSQDIKYSWERAARRANGGISAQSNLNDIAGIDAVFRGEALDIFGVRVPSDDTVEVNLVAPNVTFPIKMGHPWSWVWVQQARYEADPAAYFEGRNGLPLANGPFQIDEWIRQDRLTMSRNPYFHGEPANLDSLQLLFNRSAESLLRMYANDELDLVSVEPEQVASVAGGDRHLAVELRRAPLGPLCLCFCEALPPVDDPLVRRALYQAIDRQAISEAIGNQVWESARSMQTPDLPWFNPSVRLPSFDPAAARAALASSSWGAARRLPPLRLPAAGRGLIRMVWEQIQAMWETHLGMEAGFDSSTTAHVGLHGRGYSWPDIGCLPYAIWETEGVWSKGATGLRQPDGSVTGHYRNPALDALLRQADATTDSQARRECYYEAERMAIAETFNLPLWHRNAHCLVKPWVMDHVPNFGFSDLYGARPSNIWIAAHE